MVLIIPERRGNIRRSPPIAGNKDRIISQYVPIILTAIICMEAGKNADAY